MNVNVVVDVAPLVAGLKEYARQIPFAVSYAMNLTAKDCVAFMRKDIHRIFTIRNNWEAMGITFKPANKRDLSVIVGSRHDYMAAQVEGGIKRPHDTESVPVPQVGKNKPRPLLKSVTKPPKWPKAIMTADPAGTFIGKPKGARFTDAAFGVWRRIDRNTKSGKIAKTASKRTHAGLTLLYTLAPTVKIPARWPMEKQVETVWNARWYANAAEAIEYAVRKSYEKRGIQYQPGVRYRIK